MARLLSASASRCRPVTPRRNSAPCIGKNPPSTNLSRRTRKREPAGMMPGRPPEQRIECRIGRRWTRAVPPATQGERIMAHVLLIDDDLSLTPDQVHRAFPAPAHTVAVACTGAAGLERVCAVAPDVILLDLRLPDQSGLDVYQQIRRIDAHIPVIFVTM